MSQMNLFTWLRDGVRQSVLLGVSDAVEQLGTPASTDELHPSVTNFLQVDKSDANGTPNLGAKKNATRSRKRLGKSLKEMGPGANET